MTLNTNQTVREIVVENPETVRIFASFGIDYCCGDRQSLQNACIAASVPLEDVLQRLRGTPQTAGPEGVDHCGKAKCTRFPIISWKDTTLIPGGKRRGCRRCFRIVMTRAIPS
jgi:hypothetical protein